jgi:hypothetical protein
LCKKIWGDILRKLFIMYNYIGRKYE